MARIFQTYAFGDAQLKIALVDSPGMAELLVCRVAAWGMASGDALWFITRDRDDATVRVNFCSPGEADLRACFVPNQGAAGWQTEHWARGRLS